VIKVFAFCPPYDVIAKRRIYKCSDCSDHKFRGHHILKSNFSGVRVDIFPALLSRHCTQRRSSL